MPAELPSACSLSAAELPTRLAEIASLGRAALRDAWEDRNRAVLTFAAGAGVRERLDAIVAAESECCAFLAMTVADEPGFLVLTIWAPEGAERVLRELVGAFGAVSQR